ncbi:MAG TPA: hypothetical protein PLL66_03550 [Bacteroidales bacterium]|nr:hypothetical protein [Bacteroidales bacterium]
MKEKININNYEAWWVDYLDGKLSESDEEKLFAFLESNPKISSNLIDTDDFMLSAPDIRYPEKSSLKADSQIENLLIAKIENEINSEDNKFISERIETDKKVATAYSTYQKTILVPDSSIVFEGKKYLKKKEVIPLYKYASAAAVFALVFGIGYLFTRNVPEFDKGQPAQISFFEMPDIVIDTLNQEDEFYNNQSDNSEKIIYASKETNEESTINYNFKNDIEVPVRLPLSKIEKFGNHFSPNENELLAYQVNQPIKEEIAFEYEFQYVKSPNDKENKFKTTISKVYNFVENIDIEGTFDKIKKAKEDLFITMN